MADPLIILGIVAAGIQCTDVGIRLLVSGSSLCSKLREAPDKVQRWLDEIKQLIALTELMRQLDTDLPPSSSKSSLLRAKSSKDTAILWVEAALQDCTTQALAVEDVLKLMLQDVNDGRGQKIWKSILTVKRDSKITSAFCIIERQKTMMNIWLGQNNLRQLDGLHHSMEDFRSGVEKVNRHINHIHQNLTEEFRTSLSKAVDTNSEAISVGFASSANLTTSNVEFLAQRMYQNHGELHSESVAANSQLRALTQEIKTMKHEFQRLATFRSQAAQKPSLLKDALDEYQKSNLWVAKMCKNFENQRSKQHFISERSPSCSCGTTTQLGAWSFFRSASLTVKHRNIHTKDCAVHKGSKKYSTAIRCFVQSTILGKLVKLSFEATKGAGGFSLGLLLRTTTRVKRLSLESLFRDIYNYYKPRNVHRTNRILHDDKSRPILIRLVRKELMRAFNSGAASPNDIDCYGGTLLHLQTQLCYFRDEEESKFHAEMVRLLISMGINQDITNDSFRTAQQSLVESFRPHRIDEDILEWTGTAPYKVDGVKMIDCIRHWPESNEGEYNLDIHSLAQERDGRDHLLWLKVAIFKIAADANMVTDWGYPYICDVILRKSTEELKLFIARGMKPAEHTYRRLTPLHLAAAAGWPVAVKLLLESGADRYAQDSESSFPIDYAIQTRCVEAVDLLSEGDCLPYFVTPYEEDLRAYTMPNSMLKGIMSGTEEVSDALVKLLGRLRHSVAIQRPYHAISWISNPSRAEKAVDVAGKLFAAGFCDLEQQDNKGRTPLMIACLFSLFELASFLLDRGANASTLGRDLGLPAGYYLAETTFHNGGLKPEHFEIHNKLLRAAFDISNTVDSRCRCSPLGFTPVTALSRPNRRKRRARFHEFMSCLKWPTHAVEEQVRAFALVEIFNRLEMTHTCIDILNPSRKIVEEDRHGIESDEDEFNDQLQEFMKEYDLKREEFEGEPLEYLDFFFEMHEQDLPNHRCSGINYNSIDCDLLGPGERYQFTRLSFIGNKISYGHTEAVKEENMLALLFGEDYERR